MTGTLLNGCFVVLVLGACGPQGYHCNGTFQTYIEGIFAGTCGAGTPYYLLCTECRERYLVEGRASVAKCREESHSDLVDKTLPYARLLLMAPDLLGSVESAFEQGELYSS